MIKTMVSILPLGELSISDQAALAALADGIYPLCSDAELARFMAGELLDGYFDGHAVEGPAQQCGEQLLVGYSRARSQMNILADYVIHLSDALREMDRAATQAANAGLHHAV